MSRKIKSTIASRVKKTKEKEQLKSQKFPAWKKILSINKIKYTELHEEYEKYFKCSISYSTFAHAWKAEACEDELFDKLLQLMAFVESELELI